MSVLRISLLPPCGLRRVPYALLCVAALTLCTAAAHAQPADGVTRQPRVVSERVVSDAPPDLGEIEGAELLPEGQPEAPRSPVRLYHQDAGSRVEELRVRGETQSITVQPSGNLPAYEVQPRNTRNRQMQADRHGSDGTTGPRRWKIGEF